MINGPTEAQLEKKFSIKEANSQSPVQNTTPVSPVLRLVYTPHTLLFWDQNFLLNSHFRIGIATNTSPLDFTTKIMCALLLSYILLFTYLIGRRISVDYPVSDIQVMNCLISLQPIVN